MSWVVLGSSVTGSSHIKEGLPCQDAWATISTMDEKLVIVAVSDGAGSRSKSHLGSSFLVDCAVRNTVGILEQRSEDFFSDESDFRTFSEHLLTEIVTEFNSYAIDNNLLIDDLACTLILCIISQRYTACINIGDGRAAVQTVRGGESFWHPIMVPYKGAYANETVFFTSLLKTNKIRDSSIWNCQLIEGSANAVVLMTDGCEDFSFLLRPEPSFSDSTAELTKFDLNQPFAPFLDGVLNMIRNGLNSGISKADLNGFWKEFLQNGTQKIENEPDDKTLVFVVPGDFREQMNCN